MKGVYCSYKAPESQHNIMQQNHKSWVVVDILASQPSTDCRLDLSLLQPKHGSVFRRDTEPQTE